MKQNLNDTELLLTDEVQKESRLYLEEIDKVHELKIKMKNKKSAAGAEIPRLERELAEMETQYMFETDKNKLQELAQKKKDIRYEIDEYKSILKTKCNPVIKDMLKSTVKYREKAEREKAKFDSQISKKIQEYNTQRQEFEKAIREKIEALEKLQRSHKYNQASAKHMGILMDKADW
ncbi:hypothetical protein [Petroclostridium sp. X23]|uniref:hypothetical protein n=1 Tax=Petroclostridium sp. X23 TaxID=3045146 RepID=UPI0024AD3844|nr:hypothetical protein [Petroclostridium sp. X23]WHH60407.1 hypothetical protein QKW49_06695 [Petroclostridium sp. X23]